MLHLGCAPETPLFIRCPPSDVSGAGFSATDLRPHRVRAVRSGAPARVRCTNNIVAAGDVKRSSLPESFHVRATGATTAWELRVAIGALASIPAARVGLFRCGAWAGHSSGRSELPDADNGRTLAELGLFKGGTAPLPTTVSLAVTLRSGAGSGRTLPLLVDPSVKKGDLARLTPQTERALCAIFHRYASPSTPGQMGRAEFRDYFESCGVPSSERGAT